MKPNRKILTVAMAAALGTAPAVYSDTSNVNSWGPWDRGFTRTLPVEILNLIADHHQQTEPKGAIPDELRTSILNSADFRGYTARNTITFNFETEKESIVGAAGDFAGFVNFIDGGPEGSFSQIHMFDNDALVNNTDDFEVNIDESSGPDDFEFFAMFDLFNMQDGIGIAEGQVRDGENIFESSWPFPGAVYGPWGSSFVNGFAIGEGETESEYSFDSVVFLGGETTALDVLEELGGLGAEGIYEGKSLFYSDIFASIDFGDATWFMEATGGGDTFFTDEFLDIGGIPLPSYLAEGTISGPDLTASVVDTWDNEVIDISSGTVIASLFGGEGCCSEQEALGTLAGVAELNLVFAEGGEALGSIADLFVAEGVEIINIVPD